MSDKVHRRDVLAGAAAAVLGGAALSRASKKPAYRAAVIGHTGRGNYGHGLDRVWRDIPGVEVVGVADADAKGLAKSVRGLNCKGYADYRKMLDETKPDLVTVGPRWLDQHRDMVVAAAERGVRGIYCEKPLCQTLAQADEMIAACEKHKVRVAVAHQTRYSPKLKLIRQIIAAGRIGRVIEIRARGKEDRRGGGEDLWVLGTHMLNLMNVLGGEPRWCFATVRQGGKPITKADVYDGKEGIGPLAGDEVHAMYSPAGGATGYFDSTRDAGGKPTRFGVVVYGSKGIIESIETGELPQTAILEDSAWSPGRTKKKWQLISSAGIGKPEPLKDGGLHGGNVRAVKDLIDAIENNRDPIANIREARTAIEMIVACFESQRTAAPVTFPLKTRKNPLTLL
jgi:predicted dehydrogenase